MIDNLCIKWIVAIMWAIRPTLKCAEVEANAYTNPVIIRFCWFVNCSNVQMKVGRTTSGLDLVLRRLRVLSCQRMSSSLLCWQTHQRSHQSLSQFAFVLPVLPFFLPFTWSLILSRQSHLPHQANPTHLILSHSAFQACHSYYVKPTHLCTQLFFSAHYLNCFFRSVLIRSLRLDFFPHVFCLLMFFVVCGFSRSLLLVSSYV